MSIAEASIPDEIEGVHSELPKSPDSQSQDSEEEQCAEYDDFCLAGIPWLPKEIGAPLDETKHMQNILNVFPEDDPRRKRRKDLYEAIVQTFPEFLPARYHSMDGLALHENSKDGKYWANSTAFLLSSRAFGCTFLMLLNRNLKLEQELTQDNLDTSMYKKAKNFLLKGNEAEECQSAAEFLLEPWVLLQVPLQPMVMLQWSIGALAAGLRFQKEILDLLLLHPKNMRKFIDPLFKMLPLLVECVFAFHTMAFGQGFHLHIMANWNSRLVGKFARTIDILEFILSDKCKNVINALKRMAWRKTMSSKKSDSLTSYHGMFDLGSVPSYLNYPVFWKKGSSLKGFVESPTNEIEMSLCVHNYLTKWGYDCAGVELPATKDDVCHCTDVSNFVNEKLLQTGRIQGNKTIIPDFVKNIVAQKDYSTFLNYYKTYLTYSETSGKLKGTGIIYDITALYSDVVLAEVEAQMIDHILKAAKQGQIMLNAVNCEGPDLTLNQVKHTLSKVYSKTSCSFYKQLEQVNASFKPEHSEFPDYEQGVAKIAAHLQERIKRLVFSMIQKQLKSLQKTSMSYYPECQFVQMVLPCFVASILDMDKDESVSEDKKRKFIDYVHELIKSYENYEFCQKLAHPSEKCPFTLRLCNNIDITISILFRELEIAFRNSFGESRVIDAIFGMGPSFKFCKIMFKDYQKCSFMLDWVCQMFMLGNRMCNAYLAFFDCDFYENYFEICFVINCFDMCVDLDSEDQQVYDVYTKRYDDAFISSGKEPDMADCNSNVLELWKSAGELSKMNMTGIALFLLVKNLNMHKLDEVVMIAQGPGFALDPVDSAFWHLYCGDLIKLKQCLKKTREGDVDLHLVPIQVARSNACYKSVLKHLTSDGKVPMKQPGETTFYPVQHCRWCGLVEPDAFLVCPLCADTPEYPDLNFFCSSHCQNEALEKQHQEEHASFLMAKCGIV